MSLTKILKEALSNYSSDGKVVLYHYSSDNKEFLKLQPNRLGQKSWSKREMMASDYPRTFFYVDISDPEMFFNSSHTLYKTIVDENSIYDITVDPQNIKDQVRKESGGAIDMDILLRKVHKSGFMGIFYTPKRDLVAIFEPVIANKVDQENGKFMRTVKPNLVKEYMNSKAMVFISAERGDKDPDENNRRTNNLLNDLMASKFDFTKSTGGFIENKGQEDEKEVIEKSFMLWSDSNDDLFEFGKLLTKKYNQDSFMWIPKEESVAYFVDASGTKDRVGTFTPSQGEIYFTRVGKFEFTFK